ncbi:MAG: GTP-binding protein EngA [Bacteroidota bacterium]|jgi:GTP-binding protein
MGRIVAIVGRPNVGKSTLFNRLTESRSAIVDDESGVTRDRQYGKSEWNGMEFSLIDTGGYVEGSDDIFESEIRKQAKLAIDEADIILFVTDVQQGITALDEEVARMLRSSKKNVLLVVNKSDGSAQFITAMEFYSLGFEEYFPVSAMNGSGTGELCDRIVELLPGDDVEQTNPDIPRLVVVGRPNVGKSSLINAFIGEDRNIVTDQAGTTRDSLETRYQKFGFDFYLVDTAGMRKRAKVSEDIEFYSVMRAVRAIEYADVCIVMLDASRGIETQDLNIFHLALRNSKGVVILVNKWDLVEKDSNTAKEFEKVLRERLAPFVDVPVIFISALNKQRIHKAIETAIEVHHNRIQKIPTSKLNEVMLPEIEHNPPPATKGKYVKIKYITQLPTHTPSFAFYANLPQYVKEPYKRFLENKLRKHFSLTGVPINVFLRKK